MDPTTAAPPSPVCSFCGKSVHELALLIKGQGETYICAECVELCHALVVEHCDAALPRLRDALPGQNSPEPRP